MDDNDQPRSLKALFASAESLRLSLEAGSLPRDSAADAVSSSIALYEKVLRLISDISLFSPNEALEDLSTSDLPYLLTNFHLAELLQQLPSPSPHERKCTLSTARDAYERFLHLLDSYELLAPPSKKLLAQYTDSPNTFSTVSSTDATLRRNAKIANLQTEKALRSKLALLRSRPEYADFESASGRADEEAVRAVHLAHLDFSTHMTFQALESMNREWDVLAQAPEPLMPSWTSVAEDDQRRREHLAEEDGGSGASSSRVDMPLRRLQSALGGPLLTKQGKPLQPFTLLGNRQELAKGVFRPGHNLPTMTIDEYLEEEKRRGGIIEGGGEASGRRPEPDEDNYEKADIETYKARAWDEFTESNAKGSGNTLNRG
ncbi:TAP42-like protein [Cercophora scortea]|uniref:TAP42-like protein n=1 Tax=Cercophora scortea TaxID=314031 RepID=A0AAE0IES7_9PEZI|nr:TAP42-like protein [Cercophora scortea]